ncbi:MAG TPA: hypothetical protein PKC67_07395 [Kiritimatiellia bacterium]|nr:hypothetical protein [Kiritimatiellia bacterium]HMP34162.1 hypothetical protein [Kiritimatiellia bacterium]
MSAVRTTTLHLVVVVAALLVILLVPFSAGVQDRVWRAWFDAAHLPAFALLTVVALAEITRARLPRTPVSLGLIAAVPLIEWLQGFSGRDPSWSDALWGWGGIAVGWVVVLAIHANGKRRLALALAATSIIVISLMRPVSVWRDHVVLRAAYPVLVGFDTRWVESRWHIQGLVVVEEDGGWWAQVTGEDAYPGLFLVDLPHDWRGVAAVVLDVTYEGTADSPVLWWRMDDLPGNPPYAERFQRAMALTGGRQVMRIERASFELAGNGRAMALERILAAGLFLTGARPGDRLWVHRIEVIPGVVAPISP